MCFARKQKTIIRLTKFRIFQSLFKMLSTNKTMHPSEWFICRCFCVCYLTIRAMVLLYVLHLYISYFLFCFFILVIAKLHSDENIRIFYLNCNPLMIVTMIIEICTNNFRSFQIPWARSLDHWENLSPNSFMKFKQPSGFWIT